MKKLISILFAIVLAGCSTLPADDGSRGVAVQFHGDKAFTPAERVELAKAAKEWDNATGGLGHIEIVYDGVDDKKCENVSCLVRLNENSIETIMGDMEACGGQPCLLGYTEGNAHIKGTVQLSLVADRDAQNGGLKLVAEHEFGHALGLSHIGSRWALMYPGANADQKGCITYADIKEFCRVNRCGTHRLNPCD